MNRFLTAWLATAFLLPGCSEKKDTAPASNEETREAGLPVVPQVAGRRFDTTVRDIVAREDPLVDGWASEAFAESAADQLKLLGKLLAGDAGVSAEMVCAPGFTAPPLRPQELETVFKDGKTVVHRPVASPVAEEAVPGALFPDKPGARTKFKITSASQAPGVVLTRCLFQAAHSDGATRTGITSTWDCTWTRTAPPLLKEIAVSDYEEVRSAAGFADCTTAALGNTGLLESQFAYGRDHWYSSLESALGVDGRGNGIAVGDADGDGLEDLYICQPAALPNRLLLRQRDGSLRDVSAGSGVDWLDSTRGALFVDLDNDGDQDLVLSQTTTLLLHENDGSGGFPLRGTVGSVSLLFSINAVDYDLDGDLDLFACGYSGAGQIGPGDIFASPVPYHDANNGAPNALLRNDGDWSFTDVTGSSGLATNNLRFSLASAWEDYDRDGDPDLYVANDFGRNNLYRNDRGKFTDVASAAGVEDIGPGMSAAWGDANNDGLPDLYVSNMFSSAGSRITGQKAFKPGAAETDLAGFRRHARGNSLFVNQGDGTFADRAVESGTVMGRWAWGSLFTDFNNDGWEDLYVTNGFVTADDKDDL